MLLRPPRPVGQTRGVEEKRERSHCEICGRMAIDSPFCLFVRPVFWVPRPALCVFFSVLLSGACGQRECAYHKACPIGQGPYESTSLRLFSLSGSPMICTANSRASYWADRLGPRVGYQPPVFPGLVFTDSDHSGGDNCHPTYLCPARQAIAGALKGLRPLRLE